MANNKRKTKKELRLEKLESRELMAVDFSMSGDTLKIYGDVGANHVHVKYVGKDIFVDTNSTITNGFSLVPFKKTLRKPANAVAIIKFYGRAGNDYFDNDTRIKSRAFGGDGNDRLYGGPASDYLSGGDGNDKLYGGNGNDHFSGGSGHDVISAGGGNDKMYGGTGNDKLYGGSGNDYMAGYKGNDYLDGGSGNDTVRGNSGHDELYGGSGNDKLQGFSGNDKMYGGTGNDKLYGGSGNDYMAGYKGNDYLDGGSGNDTVRGNAGHDELYGGSGNDKLQGYSGNDKMYGGTGNDKMYGGSGNDYMAGYKGNDYLDGGSGNDTVRGNSGHDELYGGSGNDKLQGFSGNDKMYGGTGNDKLYGGTGDDKLYGNDGRDQLFGELGNDRLYGGKQDDMLVGGAGNDALYGEQGTDRFNASKGFNLVQADATSGIAMGRSVAEDAVGGVTDFLGENDPTPGFGNPFESLKDLDPSKAGKKLEELGSQVAEDLANSLLRDAARWTFDSDSNQEEVRSRIAENGWFAAYGTLINEADYAQLIAGAFVPGLYQKYFTNLIEQNLAKLQKTLPDVATSALKEAFKRSIQGETVRFGNVELKAGIATYRVTGKAAGGTITTALPNRHQAYVAFRFFKTDPSGRKSQNAVTPFGKEIFIGLQPTINQSLATVVLHNDGAYTQEVNFRWGAEFPLETYTLRPNQYLVLSTPTINQAAISPFVSYGTGGQELGGGLYSSGGAIERRLSGYFFTYESAAKLRTKFNKRQLATGDTFVNVHKHQDAIVNYKLAKSFPHMKYDLSNLYKVGRSLP